MKTQALENSHYFQRFQQLQHTKLVLIVDPGTGKLALLSTLSVHNNTKLVFVVDPGIGKLALLSTLSVHHNTLNYSSLM